jgi:UDP-N-acetylglucosamine diphosphorylase/glucosamine-1-phosphate N-acetyltransferase
MKIILFEDENVANLYPLTYLRPVFDLRCGIFTLKEKVQKVFPGVKLFLETRDELDGVTAEKHGGQIVNSHDAAKADDDILLVNAGAILTGDAGRYAEDDCVGTTESGEFVWAFLTAATAAGLGAVAAVEMAQKAARKLGAHTVEDILIRYPWDLINNNPSQITADYKAHYKPERKSAPLQGAAMMGPAENLYIGENVEIQPHTWIDCRKGPVVISDNCVVTAHTSIHAPCFLGAGAQLFEAKVREGCSIGPVCRCGGEIEESIIHACSNKYHEGFLGHSYVCEWVNLGALTTNSDLKNDYSSVSVYVQGQPVDTGSMKVGSFIGDHTKTSIGTLLNTGSNIGIMCNLLAGAGVLPKYVPPFAWYLQDRISKGLGLDYSLETARMAMSRRKQELTEAMVDLIRHVAEMTAEDRMSKIKRDRKRLRSR